MDQCDQGSMLETDWREMHMTHRQSTANLRVILLESWDGKNLGLIEKLYTEILNKKINAVVLES